MTRSICPGSHNPNSATARAVTSTSGSSSQTKLHTAFQAPCQRANSRRYPVSSTMLRGNEIMKDLQDVLLVRDRHSDTLGTLTRTPICCNYLGTKPGYPSDVPFPQHEPTTHCSWVHGHQAAPRGDGDRRGTSPRPFNFTCLC